ncbi:MAG: hypothetical protein ACE5E6_05335 [Phycisphaerae bacterium]
MKLMARQVFKVAIVAVAVSASADVALAGFLPDPFSFSFVGPVAAILLLPLQLAGCA